MKTLGEAGNKFFMNKNGVFLPEETIIDKSIRLKQEEEARKAAEGLMEADKQKQEEINSKVETLEMLPIGNKVILMPYPVNPYRQIIKNGLIIDYDGSFLNPDSGEMDKMKVLVGCAKVVEVGPECKFLMSGDDVYYDTRTVYPLPFMSLGYVLTSEPQILCQINEGLKARFSDGR